jgi:hypothetical protein
MKFVHLRRWYCVYLASRRLGWFFIAGLGLGWLVGMSVSPVIQGIITALTGLIVMVTGLFSQGDRKHNDSEKDGFPVGLRIQPAVVGTLTLGIVLGAVFGILTRTNNWLGKSDSAIVAEWESLGLERKDVAGRLFEYRFPKTSASEDKKLENPDSRSEGGGEKSLPVSDIRLPPSTGALIAGQFSKNWKDQLCKELKYIHKAARAKDNVLRLEHEKRLKELLTLECPDKRTKERALSNENDPPLLQLLAEVICAAH